MQVSTLKSPVGRTSRVDIEVESKVLCIDDDPDISRAVRLRLERFNVTVLRAFHGTQGVWMARTEHPDLIITDFRLPQGQGDYVVESLKSDPLTCSIPIVVLSAQRSSEIELKLRRLGVSEFLQKPCSPDDLISAVDKHLRLDDLRRSPAKNSQEQLNG